MKVDLLDHGLLKHSSTDSKVYQDLMEFDPFSLDTLDGIYHSISKRNSWKRKELSHILLAYNQKINNNTLALENCLRLSRSNAVTIVAGQQAGFCSGPLYTIYKIVSTIKLAKLCEKRFSSPVIPIFWNATEDHDLSEVNWFQVGSKRWQVPFPKNGVAIEHLTMNTACRNLISTYLQSISNNHYHEEIETLLALDFDNYALFSSAFIARLFQKSGLVIMEPRLFRELVRSSFLSRWIHEHSQLMDCLEAGATAMELKGLSPAFQRSNGTGLFYINSSGKRRHIRTNKNGFFLDADPIDAATILNRIETHPECFSAGVFSRPIWQSHIFPVLAYFAGPNEFHYYLQLRPLYEHFNLSMPAVYPRNHATVLRQSEQRLAQHLGIEFEEFFRGAEKFYRNDSMPAILEAHFRMTRKKLTQVYTSAYEILNPLLHSATLSAFEHQLYKELDKLYKKSSKAYLRQRDVDNAKVDRLFAIVYPRNNDQERILNVLTFIEYEGLGFIDHLLENFDPFEQRHYLLKLEQPKK